MIQIEKIIISLLLLVFLQTSPPIANASPLKDHPSPYLNMHANDPQQWWLWGKDVMQRESYSNKAVLLCVQHYAQ